MKPNKKIYISLAAFLVLGIFLILFLIYPFFKEIKKNSQELLSQKKKLILLTQEKENFEKIKTLYKTYQSNLEKIENILIDPEMPVKFINFLEKTSRDSQLQLEISSMTKKTEKGDPWSNLSLQLSLGGPFSNLLKFLEKLENSPYLIEIINLNAERLSERELGEKELFLGDTSISLLIKVFTR